MSEIFKYPFQPIYQGATPRDFSGTVADVPYLGVYQQESTQRFIPGTRHITWDGRVYKYSRASADLEQMKRAVKGYQPLVTQKAAIVSAAVAGSQKIKVTFDGDFWDTAIAEDELAGGFISLYCAASGYTEVRQQRMIVGNTAVPAAGGVACILDLEYPLDTAEAANDNCEILANPYRKVMQTNDGGYANLGMPNVLATSGKWFWIQTWGICRVSPTGTEMGQTNIERQLCFDNAGSIITHKQDNDLAHGSYQHAGFMVERTDQVTAGSAAPFVMLQISI